MLNDQWFDYLKIEYLLVGWKMCFQSMFSMSSGWSGTETKPMWFVFTLHQVPSFYLDFQSHLFSTDLPIVETSFEGQ